MSSLRVDVQFRRAVTPLVTTTTMTAEVELDRGDGEVGREEASRLAADVAAAVADRLAHEQQP